ncbi:MAG: endonuclease I family protein, partial [Candidatus Izemoplasmatales bacterium]
VLSLFVFIGCNTVINDTNTTVEQTSIDPTTDLPVTEAPTEEPTKTPTTEEVTEEPTEQPTTEVPTTEAPTTVEPTTEAPTTEEITEVPTTEEPTETPTTEEITSQEPAVLESIVIIEQDRFYEIDETFNYDALTVKAIYDDGSEVIVDNKDLSIRGFSTSVTGERNAYIIYNRLPVEYNYIVLEDYAFEIDNEYYEDAINLRGNTLKITLNTIIRENFIPLLYGDAPSILEESDADPNNFNHVLLLYPGEYGASVPNGYQSSIGGYYWNREHVWPQSRLGMNVSYDNDFPSIATDVHNLKPADGEENAFRSNHYFDNITTDNTYEPNDNVKGDIARILFYMATMYLELSFNDLPNSQSNEKTMGMISVLLEWNRLDPVDEFEMNRNNVIYSHQGNRNPFIDYPEFAELIWGDLAE